MPRMYIVFHKALLVSMCKQLRFFPSPPSTGLALQCVPEMERQEQLLASLANGTLSSVQLASLQNLAEPLVTNPSYSNGLGMAPSDLSAPSMTSVANGIAGTGVVQEPMASTVLQALLAQLQQQQKQSEHVATMLQTPAATVTSPCVRPSLQQIPPGLLQENSPQLPARPAALPLQQAPLLSMPTMPALTRAQPQSLDLLQQVTQTRCLPTFSISWCKKSQE